MKNKILFGLLSILLVIPFVLALQGDYDGSESYGVPDIDGMKAMIEGRETCNVGLMDMNDDGLCTEVDLWAIMANVVGCVDNDDDNYYTCENTGGGYNGLKDLNDNDPLVNPGADEICGNAVDEDQDGVLDNGC